MKNESHFSRAVAQPLGLGRRFRHAAKLLVLLGVALIATGLFAEVASASNTEPTLTKNKATFTIPAGNPPNRVWQLSLWEVTTPQKRLGEDSGTSGKLIVAVPAVPGCYFQVDVLRSGVWYSGYKEVIPDCGGYTTRTTTTSAPATTAAPTTITTFDTATTVKPKTGGSHGGSPTTASKGGGGGKGPATKSATSVPSSDLAFTGTGLAMWVVALLGMFLAVSGSVLLVYARRYPRKA
jgi:hypothetical protein